LKIAFLTTDSREHFHDYSNPNPYFGTAPQALLAGFEDFPGIEVHVVSCVQSPVRSPATIGRNLYYHSLLVPKLGWLRSGYLGCRRAVLKLLDRLQPDLVHGQGTERDCALSAVFSGRPSILTVHGNMRRIARLNHARPFSFGWITARLEGVALRRAAGVVCITQHTKREVENLARRVWVVSNAVDPAFFSVKRNPVSPPLLVCVATISSLKNQQRLIAAVDSPIREQPIRLLFLGLADGSDYSKQFQQILSSRPWCEHRGFVKPPELRQILGSVSGLVLPSLEENCPMVILEAIAAGTPVLASSVGGIPELIDSSSGWLFDPLAESDIAGRIREFLSSSARANAMAEFAREKGKERFHPKVVAARHLEIYREMLNGSRSAAS